jgi:hypothetical protein
MRRFGAACCVVAAVLAGAVPGRPAFGDDTDKVDGAIWRFSLKRTASRTSETRIGAFRVYGMDLYQPTKPGRVPRGADWRKIDSEVVGKKVAQRSSKGKTALSFDKLRTRSDGTIHDPMKGKAVLEFDEAGKWHGRFIDSDGRHWDFNAERVQE